MNNTKILNENNLESVKGGNKGGDVYLGVVGGFATGAGIGSKVPGGLWTTCGGALVGAGVGGFLAYEAN